MEFQMFRITCQFEECIYFLSDVKWNYLKFQAAPGVESRFANELPAPSGGSYGVFSSSSSHTMVGPDGKTVSHKSSTTGVNDNGKITFRTVED